MEFEQAWSLLLVTLAAALLPGISHAVRLPGIVLEILFGILLGNSGLHFGFSGEWLPFLAHLGFLVLMFQAGMDIDVAMLSRQRKGPLLFHLAVFAGTLALSWLAAALMGKGFYLALVLSTTSLGLVVPTLREAGINKSPVGQTVLIAATVADFLTLFGITVYVLIYQYGLSWRFLLPLPFFAGFAMLLKIGRLWAWWHPQWTARLLSAEDDQELGVRFSLAMLFLFIALSELVHLEPALGAFMGGSLLSVVFRHKGHLERKLSGIGYGFLIPIFFINVGLNFDLRTALTLTGLLFSFQLLSAALAVKFIPTLMYSLRGVGFRQTLAIGSLLSSRLSLIIVAATIGTKMNFISAQFKDAIVLLAVMTCLIGPSLFKILQRGCSPGEDSGVQR